MECPKCSIELAEAATYCGCGWRRSARVTKGKWTEYPRASCSHLDCVTRAIFKMKTPTGRANFCVAHYEACIQARADAKCHALGLKTTAQKRARVLEQVHRLAEKWDAQKYYPREPGE